MEFLIRDSSFLSGPPDTYWALPSCSQQPQADIFSALLKQPCLIADSPITPSGKMQSRSPMLPKRSSASEPLSRPARAFWMKGSACHVRSAPRTALAPHLHYYGQRSSAAINDTRVRRDTRTRTESQQVHPATAPPTRPHTPGLWQTSAGTGASTRSHNHGETATQREHACTSTGAPRSRRCAHSHTARHTGTRSAHLHARSPLHTGARTRSPSLSPLSPAPTARRLSLLTSQ